MTTPTHPPPFHPPTDPIPLPSPPKLPLSAFSNTPPTRTNPPSTLQPSASQFSPIFPANTPPRPFTNSTYLPRPPPTGQITPNVLRFTSTKEAVSFLSRQKTNRIQSLRDQLLVPSDQTSLPKSTRDVTLYACSRGAPNALGMRSVNEESVQHGQIWRPAALFVADGLLTKGDPSNDDKIVYRAAPSIMRPHCAIVWRDIYDRTMACEDHDSICTMIELAAAGRTAYNWLNKRHRSVISTDTQRYVEEVLACVRSGRADQYNNCTISRVDLCKSNVPVEERPYPDWKVAMELAILIIYEFLDQQTAGHENTEILMDHFNQVALLHVRGYWAGDIEIAGKKRRRSEVLNYVPHGTVVVSFDEIRTCPCQADDILSSLITIKVSKKDIVESDEVLSNPGLVTFRRGRLVLILYLLLLAASTVFVTAMTLTASSESHSESLKSILEGWTWSLALVSAIHIILIKNIFPKMELRDLAMGKRHASNLEDVGLSKGSLICLAHDARTNHLLAPGNACAYANRPSGKVQVNEMPNGEKTRELGLLVTETFAIKLQNGTPLVRRVVKNLDGSIHVDWDAMVMEAVVGRLLGDEVKVGKMIQ